MKLSKYFQLKNILEIQPFQSSFHTLKTVLYYFSFLGNIFLILFGFFFIKNVTDSIPFLFENQTFYFGIFIALFLIGYELFKRYALEQFVISVLKTRKLTISLFLGLIISLGLIAGSFYLSLNGAHRLIDNSTNIKDKVEQTISTEVDSIANVYNQKIAVFEKRREIKQSALDKVLMGSDSSGNYNWQQRASIKNFEKDINKINNEILLIEQERENKVTQTDSTLNTKLSTKAEKQLETNAENDLAFIFMTFFLEFIILIGVGFHGYYIIGSYMEMKKLLVSKPQIETRYKLLNIIYTNRKKGSIIPSLKDINTLIHLNKLNILQDEVKEFYDFIEATNITLDDKINLKYTDAVKEIEKLVVI
jgi:septum formation inhibitor MinC